MSWDFGFSNCKGDDVKCVNHVVHISVHTDLLSVLLVTQMCNCPSIVIIVFPPVLLSIFLHGFNV